MQTPLTAEVNLRIALLFTREEREAVSALLASECGNNLPFCANDTPVVSIDFALRLSN